MRIFVSRRFGKYRAGFSIDPRELAPRRGRGRPLAMVPQPRPRSYYGLVLDRPDASAELPRQSSPLRDLWTIIREITWLFFWAMGVLTLTAFVLLVVAGLFLARL
jgi:hypothetical protein